MIQVGSAETSCPSKKLDGKLCSSVTSQGEATCSQHYAAVGVDKSVKCGWTSGNCLSTGPLCTPRQEPFIELAYADGKTTNYAMERCTQVKEWTRKDSVDQCGVHCSLNKGSVFQWNYQSSSGNNCGCAPPDLTFKVLDDAKTSGAAGCKAAVSGHTWRLYKIF
eukprot:CAMPEP_0197628292 /NCGR_PEP_ID=MMETSP1338-20131121/6653_1 /TAXON_ID=43686 ORGANISM="Pelagodinium beii, Strain RCC1491" /NCGR_SAMPLE_ID=MMETSP1338 /ASSEMBLY_ACC=CAM_ASM_000754 /LENGTH=163 /DNA_ID=CAMNT_0043199243 /DNA_START=147 /DNA_END=638 /DNA_ORIENTATION=-